MTKRTSIFANPSSPTPVDVSGFEPKAADDRRPGPAEIDALTTSERFRSREPQVHVPSPRRQPMVYRTGRNVTFSVKTTPATLDAFYRLAEENGWKAGETFEKGVAALADLIKARGRG